jgi:hypothetical protein
MVIRILDIVSAADTAAQGAAVFARVRPVLAVTDDVVTISFDGVKTATSSFVNVAFVQLLDFMSVSDIKRRVRVIRSTRQINDMIRTRIERGAMATA